MAGAIEAADGHHVAAADDGVRYAAHLRDQGLEAGGAAVVVVLARHHHRRRQAQFGQPFDGAATALVGDGGILGAGDDAEAPMAGGGQARHQHAARFQVVAGDGVDRLVAQRAVEQHQRHAAALEFGHVFGGQAGGGDHAVDLELPDIGQHAVDIGLARQREQQHALAQAAQLLAQFCQQFGVVEIGQVGDQHRHHVGAARDQAAGGGVGDVVQQRGSLHHPRMGGLGDAGARLEAARHRRLRHAGHQRHVIRGDAAGFPCNAGFVFGGADFNGRLGFCHRLGACVQRLAYLLVNSG